MNMLSLSIAKNKFYSFCNGVKYHQPKNGFEHCVYTHDKNRLT